MSAPLPANPTVADLTGALAAELNRVRQAKAEPLTRARTIGYLAGVLLRALEVGQLEDRLAALEAAVLEPERLVFQP